MKALKLSTETGPVNLTFFHLTYQLNQNPFLQAQLPKQEDYQAYINSLREEAQKHNIFSWTGDLENVVKRSLPILSDFLIAKRLETDSFGKKQWRYLAHDDLVELIQILRVDSNTDIQQLEKFFDDAEDAEREAHRSSASTNTRKRTGGPVITPRHKQTLLSTEIAFYEIYRIEIV